MNWVHVLSEIFKLIKVILICDPNNNNFTDTYAQKDTIIADSVRRVSLAFIYRANELCIKEVSNLVGKVVSTELVA